MSWIKSAFPSMTTQVDMLEEKITNFGDIKYTHVSTVNFL